MENAIPYDHQKMGKALSNEKQETPQDLRRIIEDGDKMDLLDKLYYSFEGVKSHNYQVKEMEGAIESLKLQMEVALSKCQSAVTFATLAHSAVYGQTELKTTQEVNVSSEDVPADVTLFDSEEEEVEDKEGTTKKRLFHDEKDDEVIFVCELKKRRTG